MAGKYLMALDFGTGAGRCLIFDTEGREVASAYHEWSYDRPPDAQPGGREFDPELFWHILGEATQEAIARAGIDSAGIAAVSSTSQREGLVLLDEEGSEIYAGPNCDRRAWQKERELSQACGQRVYDLSGHWPTCIFAPARLLWLHEHRPELYARIDCLLMINDWVVYRLSGRQGCEPSNASETCLFDIGRLEWSRELIHDLDLPGHIFPPIYRAGQRIGEVTPEAATVTGLRPGTPVVVGGADTQCGVLGSGGIAPGDTVVVAGTSSPVQMVLNAPLIDSQARTWSGSHVVPGQWVLESHSGGIGRVLRWFRDSFCNYEQDVAEATGLSAYDLMVEEAERSPPGSNGMFCFLGSSIMNACGDRRERGIPGGFLMFSSLARWGDKNGRAHFVRSILEGGAFAVRGNCEQLVEISGHRVELLAVCGGLAKNSVWVQILADVMGIPIIVPRVKEATALGCAVCAGVGVGLFPDLSTGVKVMVDNTKVVEPRPEESECYEPLYEQWLALWDGLAQLAT